MAERVIRLSIGLILTLLMNGLAMGMVYALMVAGLVLLIRAVGILNFAQGDIPVSYTHLFSLAAICRRFMASVCSLLIRPAAGSSTSMTLGSAKRERTISRIFI